MCGIAGYFGKSALDESRITAALARMKNRGPDHRGHETARAGDLVAQLLHGRLSIIDLDPRSHQPFVQDDCRLLFNGEIYNYVELRAELEKKGRKFRTSSDTEVLLQAYLEYGEDCVKKFEGMWAFAIFDPRQKKLFLSRDRFAEKPLYYMPWNGGWLFGSEVKFLSALAG